MNKSLVIAFLLMTLALTACGRSGPAAPAAEMPQGGEAVQIANPWRNVTEAEAKALCPHSFRVPEGAENAAWSVMESAADASGVPGALVQLSFELNGLSFTAREQRNEDENADLSGMYYSWTAQEESTLRDRAGGSTPCKTYRYLGEMETADLCTWYDAEAGVSYSLGVTAKDLDGFDLRAVADAMLPPSLPTLEEQKCILETNRSIWSFEDGDDTTDWYYTFTDLDHNGLLEVLAASTQGSGVFTYVHYYEVLTDGSGIRNLYHADAEVEGPDDWPEIILDSIPCYYDRAADRYYYVCTNLIKDGAAHSITQLAALCLSDGKAEWETLASMDVQWTESGEQTSYTDSAGKPISGEDYQSAAARRFAGMEQSELKPDWIAVTRQQAEPERQDGERFETVIQIEGMEETVQYEHLRNSAVGIEMDYDYERFHRQSDPDRERFVSVWDAPDAAENYLEVTYCADDAETAAKAVRETLSQEYDLLESTRELPHVGSCLRIEASEIKGTGRMADQIQAVYIIPAPDGCRIAAAHYAIEGAEGFGRRFSYMLNTLAVIDR